MPTSEPIITAVRESTGTFTSQKLAHRLVREIEKAFGGRSSYRWSDTDGSLTATWAHD